MRILVTIPHVFNPGAPGGYGSLNYDPLPRIRALTECIQALQGYFGNQQFYFQVRENKTPQLSRHGANQSPDNVLDIIICTTQELHILNKLPINSKYYQQHSIHCDPMLVGFECHSILRNCLGQYDYYCYLEDDLILQDAHFFHKIDWFNQYMGDEAVLHPNRFEIVTGKMIQKNYIDPELEFKTGTPDYAHYFTDNLILAATVMGKEIILKRAENPHSGCFFLNARQMEEWASRNYFLERNTRFFGPLESAASLGIARTFRVYKPAPQNASFLEIQHFGSVWSKKIREVRFS